MSKSGVKAKVRERRREEHAAARAAGYRTSQAYRAAIFRRDHGRCQRCGTSRDLTLDHIVPWSEGGGFEPDNLQLLCGPCNIEKGTALYDYRGRPRDFRGIFRAVEWRLFRIPATGAIIRRLAPPATEREGEE